MHNTRPYPQHHEVGTAWPSDVDRPAGMRVPPNHTAGPPTSSWWPGVFAIGIRSISDCALGHLTNGAHPIRELAWFDRVINLLVGETVIALVLPEVGDGPFHAIVPRLPLRSLSATWQLDAGGLHYGPWRLAITPITAVWNPSPNWAALCISDNAMGSLRRVVSDTVVVRAEAGPGARYDAVIESGIARLLRAIVEGETAPLEAETQALAGLGPGLTPYGDDVLAGIILGLWAAHHPGCWKIGRRIAQAAAPNTNQLSRAFLDAASQGLANATWHRLLAALSRADRHEIERAAHRVVATGATSGAAMLRGFTAVST